MKTTKKDPVRYLSVFLGAFFTIMAVLAFLQTNLAAADEKDAEANPRTSDECLACHEDYDLGLALTPHRVTEDSNGPDVWIGCSDCHPGSADHYEEDPAEYPRTNAAKLSAVDAWKLCSTCHLNSHQQNMMENNPHPQNDVSCTDCHHIHGSSQPGLLQADQMTLCTSCHVSVKGEFARPFRHPVADGIIKCTECHLSLDVTRRELSRNGTNVCLKCHAEFQGPFPFEHQARLDFGTEEGGCVGCHDPHGSFFPRMLKQPYESPNFQLCTQCHSVPRHNSNLQHGTRWSGLACNNCHTDIHGSYANDKFLSESLEGQGCFTPGCHLN